MLGRRAPVVLLTIVFAASLAYALSLRVADSKSDGRHRGIFWSDESTYHSMAYSLAFDHDLRYERRDLERVYRAGYGGGPSGLFLVRNPDTGHLAFAKAYAYPLVAAPFVRALGDNGFFVLHALLLGLVLAAAHAYAARAAAPARATLWALTYVLASVCTLYFFWMTPEWFNFSIVFLACFLWLYKHTATDAERAATTSASARWFASARTDWLAVLLFAVAVYAKPPNAILAAALPAWEWLAGRRTRAVTLAGVLALAVAAMFGGTWYSIGDWNYQGGDRRQFNVFTSYPFLDESTNFDNTGIPMTTGVEDLTLLPPAGTFARDLVYVWIGRNGGLLPYMFPALLALGIFLRRRRRGPHALLCALWFAQLLAIVLVVRGNWIGGGGTVGSRYFVNLYPALFFLAPAGPRPAGMLSAWIVWGLFLAQIVLSPFRASLDPAAHTRHLPFTALPAELTILHNLPFNTNPNARRVALRHPPDLYAYFLDDGTWLREGDLGGFWVKGGRTAEIVLRTPQPIERIVLEVRNRTRGNEVTLFQGGQRLRFTMAPSESKRVAVAAEQGLAYEGSWLYRLAITAAVGTVPLFDTPGSTDGRNLGVFVSPTVEPATAFRP